MKQKAVIEQIKLVLIVLAGFVGTNVVLAQFRNVLPANFQKYTGLVGLAGAIYGALVSKGILQQASLGAATFSVLAVINQLLPDGNMIKGYLPQLSGMGVSTGSLGDVFSPARQPLMLGSGEYLMPEREIFAGVNEQQIFLP